MTLSPCKFARSLRRLILKTDGQDLIEYALLTAIIAGTVVIALQGIGVKVSDVYATTSSALPGGSSNPGDPGGSPGNGNPGNGNPGGGNPGGGNPGGGNPGGGNPGGGNPGGGNPGGGGKGN